jgi:hypothetical protein
MLTEPKKRDELAGRVGAAVAARKDAAEQGRSFIRPWRMGANRDVRRAAGLAECGCGIAPEDSQPR